MPAIPRCQVVPLAAHQVSFRIDDREFIRWNSGGDYPRPFFFPVLAPSGAMITRMGHPGAPDHDHHQSVWFAHNKVLGIDFWSNNSEAHVRQLQWYCYESSDTACRMAVELGWFDGHNPAPLIRQELICEFCPADRAGEFTGEIQSRFLPVAESLEFDKTNFGFLAVRVAESVAAFFGGGVLTGSSGEQTEENLFGRPSLWMDYSGPTQRGQQESEGITLIDHPQNPGQPTGWHVRNDGWMCASPCMNSAQTTTRTSPLALRYLLFCHSGAADAERIGRLHADFASTAPLQLRRSSTPHIRWETFREPAA